MRTLEEDMLTDSELSEILAAWTVPDAPRELRARVLPRKVSWFTTQARSTAAALFAQAAAVVLMLLITYSPGARRVTQADKYVYLNAYKPDLQTPRGATHGGGGSGRSALDMRHGQAPRRFVPPDVTVSQPKLAAPVTLAAPEITALNLGDPLSSVMNGLGRGEGGGMGPGRGDGYGSGEGGGSGGGVYRIGGDVSAPVLVSKVEPEYSEEARKAKYSGDVELSVTIDQHGVPRDIRVMRPLGMGLDEKAVLAVSKWRFRPAMKDGQPVTVTATVDVTFRLL